MQKLITKKCEYCGKELSRPASYFDKKTPQKSKHFFCSRSCRGKYYADSAIKAIQDYYKNRYKPVEPHSVICECCGKEYKVSSTKIKTNQAKGWHFFCSNACRLKYRHDHRRGRS